VTVQGKNFVILACVVLTQYQSVTNGRTDGRTDASTMAKTREALHAVARKNETSAQQRGIEKENTIFGVFYSVLLQVWACNSVTRV